MAYIASVAMKHEHRDIRVPAAAWAANVKRRELLAIVGRDDELFKVLKIERDRAWDLLA